MATTSSIPTVSFQNELTYDVQVYDSFSPDTETAAENNYFGQLTLLGTVKAQTTANIQPIHTSSAFIVKNAQGGKPLKRCTKLAFQTTASFVVAEADEASMTVTFSFVQFFIANPNDPVSTAFNAVLKGDVTSLLSGIKTFFAQHLIYSTCTFDTYMMAVAYTAEIPPSTTTQPSSGSQTPAIPVTNPSYSLSKLVSLLGGEWPTALPDIAVTQFICNTSNGVLAISATVDITQLPTETAQIAKNFASLFDNTSLEISIQVNYGLSAGVTGTRLSIILDTISIPVGGGSTLSITKPEISISINPLFKFVVFSISGTIPFNMLNKAFDANISMTIDNVEASVQAVIAGDNTSFPAPPGLSGIHLDEFGVGIGVFFDPPGIAIGLEGTFHIGDTATQTVVQIDDNTFTLVCSIVEEVPDPVYLSFYVPSMDMGELVEMFTNAKPSIPVPVSFSDLSFRWSQNPMTPVTLPDGTLSPSGYAFSASAGIASFLFYGNVQLDLTNGLTANIEMAPIQLGNLFSLAGDGAGITIKVDANGNPIKNNQIATTSAMRQAIASATNKVLVPPGGPVLVINTLTSPILQVNARVSVFDQIGANIGADITKDGILFELSFSSLIAGLMQCKLADFHNFYALFLFYIARTIPIPTIGGYSLGSINLNVGANTEVSVTTALQGIQLSVSGSFTFATTDYSFGPYSLSMGTNKLADLLEGIVQSIEGDAMNVFHDLYSNAYSWAYAEISGLVSISTPVTDVLRNGFQQTASASATVMKTVGYEAGIVATGLKSSFSLLAQGVAAAMQAAGYTSDEVAGALKNVFSLDQIASAVGSVYGLSADAVNTTLQKAGYAASDIANAFKSLGGSFADAVSTIFNTVNPF